MRLTPFLLFFSVLMLPLSTAVSAFECFDSQFRPKHTDANVEQSLAQVFKTGGFRQEDYLGTAFVIDATNQLLLTAAHVVERANPSDARPIGETVNLRFPGIKHGSDAIAAKVIHIFEGPSDNPAETMPAGQFVEDVALLKLSDQHSDMSLEHLRLYMTEWYGHFQHNNVTVHSYYGASNDVITIGGNITRESNPTNVRSNLRCAMNVGVSIDGGDSGAPVLNENGFVVALVIQDFPKGGRKFGRVMPVYCLTDYLPGALEDVIPKAAASLAELIYDGSGEDVTSALMPSETPRQEASNPLIHHALTKLGRALVANDWSVNAEFLEKLQCPIMRAAIERRIQVPKTIMWALVNQLAEQSTSLKESGDKYLQALQSLRAQRRYEAAAGFADLSRAYYAAEATRRLKNVFSAIDVLKLPKNDFGFAELDRSDVLGTAQVLKSYVDSIQASREIYAHLGYNYSAMEEPIFAQDAAVLAVLLSEERSSKLQAQSWAALGKEALEVEDYVSAFQAYQSAIAAGASQKWVKDSYVYLSNLIEAGEVDQYLLGLVEPGEITQSQNAGVTGSPYYTQWITSAEPFVERARKSVDLLSYMQYQRIR